MTYRVEMESRARRELRELPSQVLRRVDAAISALSNNPLPLGVVRVRGRVGDGWRIRVGQYRILYTVDQDQRVVKVFRVSHRREAYR